MDTFTFMIAVIFMMIAVQFNQYWLIFAIVALMVLSMRDLTATILLIIATIVLLFGKEYLPDYWPFLLFGLIRLLAADLGGKDSLLHSLFCRFFC